MLSAYLSTLVILAASTAIGEALWARSSFRCGSPVAPAVGLATVIVLAGLLVWVPGHALTAAVVIAVLAILAAIDLRGRVSWGRGLRDGLPVVIVLLAVVGIPFGVAGHFGILGVGNNNDFAAHLNAAWWLVHHHGVEPGLVRNGYPIGPHALAAALSRATGMGLEATFTGILMAVPPLAALAGLAALPEGGWLRRRLVALVVGLPYLAVSYFATGSFKETLLGLFVLAFAVALHQVRVATRSGAAEGAPASARETRGRSLRGIPPALLAAGCVYAYGYLGLVYPLGTLAVWAALELAVGWAGRRPPLAALRARLSPAGLRPIAAPVAAGAVLLAIVLAPEVHRLVAFSNSSFAHEPDQGVGNLRQGRISRAEVFGVWFRSDFRFLQTYTHLHEALVVLAFVAFFAGALWWLWRRDLAVPAAAGAAIAAYLFAAAYKNQYNAAKGLAIAAPVVMLVTGRTVLACWRSPLTLLRWSPGRWRARTAAAGVLRWSRAGTVLVAGVAGAATLAAAAYCSFAALRDATVGPQEHARELAGLRPLLRGQPTLFLVRDDFADWELRGVPLSRPFESYNVSPVPLRPSKVVPTMSDAAALPDTGIAVWDFDSVPTPVLDGFRYAITTDSDYASTPPPNWRLVRDTGSYLLFRRDGPTPRREVIDGPGSIGAPVDCATGPGRALANQPGVAGVITPGPVVQGAEFWSGIDQYPGETATQTLPLGAGDWDLSVQYINRFPVTVRAQGRSWRLPANLDHLNYWRVGTIHVARPTKVTVTVTAAQRSRFARVVGATGVTVRQQILGGLAATRHGAHARPVPLRASCGQFVDWYRIAGS